MTIGVLQLESLLVRSWTVSPHRTHTFLNMCVRVHVYTIGRLICQQAPAVSADYPYDQPATNDRAGINYLAHRPVMQFPPVLDPDVATPEYEKSDLLESFSPAHYDPTVGRSNVEHQLPCATPAHSYGSCDREVPTFPDSGGIHWPYAMVMNSHQSPDNIRATPTIARETDAWGYPGPFVSHPSGGTGNEKMVQLPAGSLPVGTKYVESQLSNKRKQAMIPDGKRKAKRIRPGNPQRPNPRGLTQVGITHPDPVEMTLHLACFRPLLLSHCPHALVSEKWNRFLTGARTGRKAGLHSCQLIFGSRVKKG